MMGRHEQHTGRRGGGVCKLLTQGHAQVKGLCE
jgi:hypothetical protein